MAMMNPASEVRLSPSPSGCIMSSLPPMAKSSELPIQTPARHPMTSISMPITITTDSTRFHRKPVVASRAIRSSG